MQLKLSRSQKAKGLMSKSVIFCLDARAEYTPEEQANIRKYKLGGQVIWNSAAGEKALGNFNNAMDNQSVVGSLTSLAKLKISLKITIDSLGNGQHIETESLDELLGAEEALMQGCQNAKSFLEVASTFDGAERVVEI